MNRGKRILACLLAIVMLAGLLPLDQLRLVPRAEAVEQSAETVRGSGNITIDFDYEKKHNVTDAQGALTQMANEHNTVGEYLGSYADNGNQDWLQNHYAEFQWRQVSSQWTNQDPEEGTLRKYLQSEDPADKYISLQMDDNHSYYKSTQWEPMVIRSDKVLDLNGHTLNIRYDSNRKNDCTKLTKVTSYHHKWAFQIENGATLTIIDSSVWRGENNGLGSGAIRFTGYVLNPFEGGDYVFHTYTTRDLFYVDNGNLVIYGGTFQAGRKKDQVKDDKWSKFKNVIGSVVGLGVNIAGYATGLNTAFGGYKDLLEEQADQAALKAKKLAEGQDDLSPGAQTMVPKDGTNQGAVKESDSNKDDPKKAGGAKQTVDEKKDQKNKDVDSGQPGTKEGENKKAEDKPAKYDSNTKLADGQNKIVNSFFDKDKVGGIVDSAFGLVDNIISMFETDESTRITIPVLGTVVKVGANSTFVAYGGTFQGYGSTPNVRNAVVEVVNHPNTAWAYDHTKNRGGLAYIYGGTFEAYQGANVFNMVRAAGDAAQETWQYTEKGGDAKKVNVLKQESGGVEVLYYENQDQLSQDSTLTPIPINTANVQVRGGTFRCFYDLMNISLAEEGADENFTKFPGTPGSVNLGVESFNKNLIKDGRIQIVDVYGDGALVLLDDKSEEKRTFEREHPGETYPESIYEYRLFCGDTELRSKAYLDVYPNQAVTNSSHSLQLSYYGNETGQNLLSVYKNDENNTRAAARQMENFFDFPLDAVNTGSYDILPLFYSPPHTEGNSSIPENMLEYDVYGQRLASSEVWYYPTPVKASDGQPIPDVAYGETYYKAAPLNSKTLDNISYAYGGYTGTGTHDKNWSRLYAFLKAHNYIEVSTMAYSSELWDYAMKHYVDKSSVEYYQSSHDSVRTNMGYYVYKLYRVDPLTRENLSESNVFGSDVPLLTVRYGDSTDSLRCKLPLMEAANWILDPNHPERNPYGWKGYQSGELYRVVLEWEEYVGMGYQGNGVFGQKLQPAKTQASILFRCYNTKERTENPDEYLASDYTPLQLVSQHDYVETTYNTNLQLPTIKAGEKATVQLLNGKAGMTDFMSRVKVFGVYYQWWECDEHGNLLNLLAGTDNIYQPGVTKWSEKDHWWRGAWNIGYDNKLYRNTVDPNDPKAYLMTWNGLPGKVDTLGRQVADTEKWSCYDLHMYTPATTTKSMFTKDGSDNLVLENQGDKIFETNQDSCYIPEELEGKYVRVRAIVLNPDWPAAYDAKQTFLSHVMLVKPANKPLDCKLEAVYQDGLEYADKDHSVSFRPTVSGLGYGEYVTGLYYWLPFEGERSKEFTGLTAADAKNLPTVSYPEDFYPADYNREKIAPRERSILVRVTTNKRAWSSNVVNFSWHLEPNDVVIIGDSTRSFKLADIQNGLYKDGKYIFLVMPSGASGKAIFDRAVISDTGVVSRVEDGRIFFGGKPGRSTVTLQSPNGESRTLTVNVIGSFNHVEIGNLFAPILGQSFNYNATVPKDAPYHVESVEWIQGAYTNGAGYESVITDPDAVAEKCRSYTVRVGIAANENMEFQTAGADYALTAYLEGGETDLKTGPVSTKWGCNGYEEYDQDKGYKVYYFEYVFDPIPSDEPGGVIENVYINFPSEVPEGYPLDKWLEELQIYTDGNDDHVDFKNMFRVTFGPDAENIAETLGSSVSYNANEEQDCRTFIKGMQNGIFFEPQINLVAHPESTFASQVNVWVNGEKQVEDSLLAYSEDYRYLMLDLSDTVTVVDGANPGPKPSLNTNRVIKDFNLVVGQPLDVSNLVECDDARVTISMSEPYCETGVLSNYLTWNEETLTITPKAAILNSNFEAKIDFTASFDLNSDGWPEYQDWQYTAVINKDNVFASAGELPSPIHYSYDLTVYEPDGVTVAWHQVITDEADGRLHIPPMENCFYAGLYDTDGMRQTWFLNSDGATLSLKSGTFTAKTVYAEDLELYAGADKVFAFVKDDEGRDVGRLQISVDGVHFTEGSVIWDLTPNTDYQLFYRQGYEGEVYSRLFRTANTEYDLRIGRIPVTDQHLGTLELDHWHYDPENNLLTLKDLSLTDVGSIPGPVALFGISLPYYGLIVTSGSLNVELLGSNTLEKLSVDGSLMEAWIYAEGDITFTGTGSLTYAGKGGTNRLVVYCGQGNIYLNGTGTQSFTGVGTMFAPSNGKTYYRNGNIDFTAGTMRIEGTLYQMGNVCNSDDWIFASDKPHSVTIQMAGLDGNYVNKTEDEFFEQLQLNADSLDSNVDKASVRITPNHANGVTTAQYQTSEYLASGVCTGSHSYHKACPTCGASLPSIYTVSAGSHNLVSVAAQAPSCLYDGWKEYQRCTKCNYNTFELDPSPGHDWQDFAEILPTCTTDGRPAYKTCRKCGLSNEFLIPGGSTQTRGADDETSLSDISDPEVLIWKASGHMLARVPAQGNGCAQPIVAEHYECINCHTLFNDPEGAEPTTLSALTLPALDHSWGMWEITTEPTATVEGVKTRVCTVCGQTETGTVPVTEWNPFVDVKRGSYYFSAVKNLFEAGVVNGTSETTFSPNQPCTRAQVVTFLWRNAGSPAPSGSNPFIDVQTGAWYYDAVLWAVENGITNGTSAAAFSPSVVCSRAQAVTLLWRAQGSPAPKSTETPFTDVNPGAWYYNAMLWAVENGVTNGTGPKSFSPDKACTRAQTVTLLDRIPVWQGALEVGQQPQGGEIDQASNDPCLILSAEGESGLYPYSYEWYKVSDTRGPDQKIEGAKLPNLAAFEPGQYYCIITDAQGTQVTTDIVDVTAKQYPPITAVTQPVGGVSIPGQPLTLSFEVTGGAGDLTYRWYCNDEEIDVAFSPELIVDCKSGNFKCVVTDRIGQTLESDTVHVTFGSPNGVNTLASDELLMYVSDVFKITGRGIVLRGIIENGTVHVNDNITVYHYDSDLGAFVPASYRVLFIQTGLNVYPASATVGEQADLLLDTQDKSLFSMGDVVSGFGSGMMPVQNYTVDLYVYTKDEGGRHTPFFVDYRPELYLVDATTVHCTVTITDLGLNVATGEASTMVMPGSSQTQMKLTTDVPQMYYIGQEFYLREGGRTIAKGTITEVWPDTVEINETNFPDAGFRTYVNTIDSDNDGWLNSTELGISTIDVCGDSSIESMKGIEFFYALQDLEAEDLPNVTDLDLRGNKQLTYIGLYYGEDGYGPLKELHLEGLTELEYLNVENSSLTSLDLRDSTKLTNLYCDWVPSLSELRLGSKPTLHNLRAHRSGIRVLDLSGCPILLDLYQNGTVTAYDQNGNLTSYDDGYDLLYRKSGVTGELFISKYTTIITGD